MLLSKDDAAFPEGAFLATVDNKPFICDKSTYLSPFQAVVRRSTSFDTLFNPAAIMLFSAWFASLAAMAFAFIAAGLSLDRCRSGCLENEAFAPCATFKLGCLAGIFRLPFSS